MKHDYIKAHNILERHNKWRRGDDSERMADPAALGVAIDIALHALLLADKVTGEPSEGMVAAGNSASDWHLRDSDDVFKAMIEQAQREVEQ